MIWVIISYSWDRYCTLAGMPSLQTRAPCHLRPCRHFYFHLEVYEVNIFFIFFPIFWFKNYIIFLNILLHFHVFSKHFSLYPFFIWKLPLLLHTFTNMVWWWSFPHFLELLLSRPGQVGGVLSSQYRKHPTGGIIVHP